MKDKTTISYTLVNTITVGIATVIACSLFIPLIFIVEDMEWWIILAIVSLCLGAIATTISVYIDDYSVTFDHMGFTTIWRNRVNSKEKIKTYKWKDIHRMSISGLYSHSTPNLTIFYKNGKFESIYFNGLAYTKKFINLARHYSGRNNIIKSGRKRKPFDKDW